MKTKSFYAMKMAHALEKNKHSQQILSSKKTPQNWSQRLQLAWYFVSFREALKNGIVTFSYWKKDGSIREARGTLSPIIIARENAPKNSPAYEPNWGAMPYYDIDKKAWRSFDLTHFVGFVSIYQLIPSPSQSTLQSTPQSTLQSPTTP